ncbi:MAG: substrate-binding domain-containing protein [Phycisphaerae bacterium]|nr:substrate-binding domain-containing protein [Phycisphaerae bacterium]
MNTMLRETGSSQRVEAYLRRAAAQAGDGQRLPSVREVMAVCSATKTEVDRVLTRLANEGLIECRPRSGFYRLNGTAVQPRLLNVLYFDLAEGFKPGNFSNEFTGYLAGRLAQGAAALRVRVMELEANPEAVVEEILRQGSQPVLTYGITMHDLRIIEPLVRNGATCLHVFPNIVELIAPCLAVDEERVVRDQVEHLVGLGHRRIAYLHGIRNDSYHRGQYLRRDWFYRLCVEFNLDVRPEWVANVGWENDTIRAGVRRIIKAQVQPTALIVYDNHINPVYAELKACGLTPGRNISVVGTDDMPWAAHVDPPLSTVRIPRVRAAEAALDMLRRIETGQGRDEVRYLETHLVDRGSTSRCQER